MTRVTVVNPQDFPGGASSGGGDGAILDGAAPTIKATVKNYTNSKPLTVVTVDTNGDYVSAGGGGLTDAQLRASAVPVSGTFYPVTQPVSIAAAVGVTDNAGSLTVDGTFWQATQPVSGTFWQVTQPVSGPLTDAQLRAAVVPVSDGAGSLTVDGTFWQATQPVSGTFWQAAQPVTDNASSLTVDAPVATPVFVRLSDGAAAIATLPVSGPVTDTQLRATPVPVSGTVTASQATGTNLHTVVDSGAITATLATVSDSTKLEDAASTTGDRGTVVLFVRNDLFANLTDANADYGLPSIDVAGRQQVREINNLYATTLSGANASVTLTIGAAGAGLFHYITSVEIVNINPTAAAIAGSAVTLSYTSTNIPGSPVWTAGNALAAGAEKVVARMTYPGAIKTTTAATATTLLLQLLERVVFVVSQ
jgi:hypothetical protein